MTVSGILITVRAGCCARTVAAQLPPRFDGIECGDVRGARIPAVLTAGSAAAAEDLVRALTADPQIQFVDVVFVGADHDLQTSA